MDVQAVIAQLSKATDQVSKTIESKMNSSTLESPEDLLKLQFAVQQYSVFVSCHSSILKNIRDLISGIIAKI